ncbi:hypothetical protein KIKIMORA_04780 [Brevundimonas phage vB_BpoS-Kikimora]|uniref:Uncharacterized protein n=1 Tax=Brevundimonas phage vB_BpoS-Kikimora TaxID=2948601 RepID=A0A9E7SLA0_9CAUD|nr:hypothetical protein KIKIMORA_04780 [Brevundimonas phage vB_BpoS-Kikimora]
MRLTSAAVMRAAAATLLAQAATLTREADRIESGDPAEINAGDPSQFSAGDPSEFTAGDPSEFSHITHPEVRESLAAGPAGEWDARFTCAVLLSYDAHQRDQLDADQPDRTQAIEALQEACEPDTGDRDRARAWAALYRFWMDRDPPELNNEAAPYLAIFTGQAMIMDHAMDVDDARWTYPVTRAEFQDAVATHDLTAFDALSDAAAAPAEVRAWAGPFEIKVRARRYRIHRESPAVSPRYADTPEQVQAILRRLFAQDAAIAAHVAGSADLIKQIDAFPSFDLKPGHSYEFYGHEGMLTVTTQWADPFDPGDED